MFFSNFISLGCYCGTASSMGKHGLRSYSFPFDWITTYNFEGALYHIETDFQDFLRYENLEQISANTFRDKKYDMAFPHDIKISLEQDYKEIVIKYQRRIERFRHSICNPVCFIRTVTGDVEAQYIQNNYVKINKIIKRGNSENEIIFLLLAGTKKIKGIPHCYMSGIDKWRDDDKIRDMFDLANPFLEYCMLHLDGQAYKKNLEFDRRKFAGVEDAKRLKEKVLELKKGNGYYRKQILYKIPEMQVGVIIWGAGFYGEEMAEVFRINHIPVKYYVDNDSKKWNTMLNGIPIVNPDKLKSAQGYVVITASKYEDAIVRQLKELKNDALRWISLRTMVFDIAVF